MAHTNYVGYGQTLTWNSVALIGLTGTDLSETGVPPIEQIDTTDCSDTTYTTMADPYGGKGDPKVTLTATLQDSTASFADTKQTTLAFNSKQAAIWATQPGTSTANQYDHAALELTARTTEITWTEPYAVCTLVFEGTAVGVWSGPA